jgi:hypothetical protein
MNLYEDASVCLGVSDSQGYISIEAPGQAMIRCLPFLETVYSRGS